MSIMILTEEKERRLNSMEYDWINMILEDDNKVFKVLETYLELQGFSDSELQELINKGDWII